MRYLLAFLCLVPASGAHAASLAAAHGWFTSNGVEIPFDLYRPGTARPLGGVLLLHGSDGLQFPNLSRGYEQQAEALAQAGFVVMVPHYFVSTGTGWADRPAIAQNFLSWAETAADAIAELGKQAGVDPKKIGVVGISLGGSLANSLATQDPRIAAVVDCFGTLPEFAGEHAARFAPTLILHGEDDRVVPVREATQLESVLRAHHVPHEIKLYPGQGHGFTGAALADAERRTLSFLTRYLS